MQLDKVPGHDAGCIAIDIVNHSHKKLVSLHVSSCCQKQMRKGDLEEGEMEESEDQQVPVQGSKRGWDTKALKHAIGLTDEDLVYISFTSEVPT